MSRASEHLPQPSVTLGTLMHLASEHTVSAGHSGAHLWLLQEEAEDGRRVAMSPKLAWATQLWEGRGVERTCVILAS